MRGAELAVLNTNEGYGQVFERIMRIWEEALRQEVVEALWQDGEQQADKADRLCGSAEAAVRRFEQAIDAARELCADSKEVRDRVVEMGRVKMLLTGGGKDQKEDADAKFALANDLRDQGAFDEAIELYYQAVELLHTGQWPRLPGRGRVLQRHWCGVYEAGRPTKRRLFSTRKRSRCTWL